jgi:signal transduction histidine kinase
VSAYRIIQEALTNVVRHAGPTTAHLHLRFGPRDVAIELVDDGFCLNAQPPRRATDGSGHGLVGMRERVALYGGHFEARPDPQGGFVVRVRLPVA